MPTVRVVSRQTDSPVGWKVCNVALNLYCRKHIGGMYDSVLCTFIEQNVVLLALPLLLILAIYCLVNITIIINTILLVQAFV